MTKLTAEHIKKINNITKTIKESKGSKTPTTIIAYVR